MLGDEAWAWPERDPSLLDAFETALVKLPTARLLLISTSAAQLDSPPGRMRARALAGEVKRSGAFIDARAPGLRWLEWSVPESQSLGSDRAVKLANPAPTITVGSLREQRERVTELAFAQFHACRGGVSEAQWLPPGAWSACRDDFEVEEGEPLIVGIDLGGSRAASSLVAVAEDLRVAHVEVFQGEQSVLQVTEALVRLAERHPITEAAYDPWRYQSEALRLERDHGLTMVQFPQSHARMVPASERLHSAVVEKRLRHRGEPELAKHVAGAIAKQTGRGWRLDKAERGAQIDAVVCLAMAVERAEARPAPVKLLGWL